MHSVEDRRFDSYNSICAYLCIDISQASDYIMEWIFNTYNDLLVNEDQNAKGRASTMAQWFSFQCLPFLCCHFCVVGSDVLPPFPSSLLFFFLRPYDPHVLLREVSRVFAADLRSADSSANGRLPEMTTVKNLVALQRQQQKSWLCRSRVNP